MALGEALKRLSEPGNIGTLEIKNRIIMPAMATGTSTSDGFVTQQTMDYYEQRAMGGAGLIIVEYTCIDSPEGKGALRQLTIDHDKYIPALTGLASVIHSHGAKAAIQLHHAGNAALRSVTKTEVVGPSAVARPGGDIPRELSKGEIDHLIDAFARSAERARNAGFDGVEIHCAHSYLLAQFLSSAWNLRQDSYGGSLENRARIVVEILQAIRDRVGNGYPVWCRINGEESGVPGGTTLEEAKATAKMLERAHCDAVSVSAADRLYPSSRPYFFPHGWARHLMEGIRKSVEVPVIGVGRITPELGEYLLQEKKVDFIAMGRALRADPGLPMKLFRGNTSEIRPCIYCGSCTEKARAGGERLCTVNPEVGREREYQIEPTSMSKKVLIIGGGPAGMEAARVAALRGHRVTLWEKGDRLGGKLLIAGVPPLKSNLLKLIQYLAAEVERLGVALEFGRAATSDRLREFKPDVAVIAIGSRPAVPQMGETQKINITTAEDVLAAGGVSGTHTAVLGGGVVGCEVAAFLAQDGKKVTIVEMLSELAADLGNRQGRAFLIDFLTKNGVKIVKQAKGTQITKEGLVVTDRFGQENNIAADAVVFACGAEPEIQLVRQIEEVVPESYCVGDCLKPGTILEAIEEGARVSRMI